MISNNNMYVYPVNEPPRNETILYIQTCVLNHIGLKICLL